MKVWKCGLLLVLCLLMCSEAIGEEAISDSAFISIGRNDFMGHWVYPGEDENYAEMDIYDNGDGSLRMSVFFLRMLSFDATLLPPEDGTTTFDDTDDELSGELMLQPDGTLLLTVLSDADNYFHDFFHGVEFVFSRDGTARTGDAEESAAVPANLIEDDFDDSWSYEGEEEGTIPDWVLSYDDVITATRDFYLGEWHRIDGKDGVLIISGHSEADYMLRLTIAGYTFDARFDSLVGDGDTMMFFTTDGWAELDMTYGVDGIHLSGWSESSVPVDFFSRMHLVFVRQADILPDPEPAVNVPEEPAVSSPEEGETAIIVHEEPADAVPDELAVGEPEEPVTVPEGVDLPAVPGRPDLLQVPVDRMNATSWIIGTKDPMAYTPERVIDGDETTSWQFSTKTTRLGEAYLYFEFNNPVTLNELWIKNGYWKTTGGTDSYTRNCRVKTMTVEFRYSAGESYAHPQSVTLPDDKARSDWQRIPLAAEGPVIGVRIRIDEIYKGTKFKNDICISEIMFVQAAGV